MESSPVNISAALAQFDDIYNPFAHVTGTTGVPPA